MKSQKYIDYLRREELKKFYDIHNEYPRVWTVPRVKSGTKDVLLKRTREFVGNVYRKLDDRGRVRWHVCDENGECTDESYTHLTDAANWVYIYWMARKSLDEYSVTFQVTCSKTIQVTAGSFESAYNLAKARVELQTSNLIHTMDRQGLEVLSMERLSNKNQPEE